MSWGSWIKHDGRGFPKHLMGVQIEVKGETYTGEVICQVGVPRPSQCFYHWDWANFGMPSMKHGWRWSKVIAYRIWRGQAFQDLAAIAANRRPVGIEGTEHDRRAPEVVD